MKYVCLIYNDEAQMEKLPKEELDRVNADYRALNQAIQKSGQFVASQGLCPHSHRDDGACQRWQDPDHGWSLCGNQGATRRHLRRRGQRPQRCDSVRRQDTKRAFWGR